MKHNIKLWLRKPSSFLILSILIIVAYKTIDILIYNFNCDNINGYPREGSYNSAMFLIKFRHPSTFNKYILVKDTKDDDGNRFFGFRNEDNQIIIYINECGTSDLVGDENTKRKVIEEFFERL